MNGLAYQNQIAFSRGDRILFLIRSVVITLSTVLLGGFFTRLLTSSALVQLAYTASAHFAFPFSQCTNWFDLIFLILKISALDLIMIGLVFILSGSKARYLISDLVLLISGFRMGFFSTLLYHMVLEDALGGVLSWGDWISFVIIKGMLLFTMLSYLCRSLSSNSRVHRFQELKVEYRLILWEFFCAFRAIFFVLILNSTYSALIYVL